MRIFIIEKLGMFRKVVDILNEQKIIYSVC